MSFNEFRKAVNFYCLWGWFSFFHFSARSVTSLWYKSRGSCWPWSQVQSTATIEMWMSDVIMIQVTCFLLALILRSVSWTADTAMLEISKCVTSLWCRWRGSCWPWSCTRNPGFLSRGASRTSPWGATLLRCYACLFRILGLWTGFIKRFKYLKNTQNLYSYLPSHSWQLSSRNLWLESEMQRTRWVCFRLSILHPHTWQILRIQLDPIACLLLGFTDIVQPLPRLR